MKNNVEEVLKETIPKYRDDPDLQSIIDWVQETVSFSIIEKICYMLECPLTQKNLVFIFL